MKLPDLLSKVTDEREFFSTLDSLSHTSEYLQTLKTAMTKIYQENPQTGLRFAESLGTSRISIALASTLAEFAALRSEKGNVQANEDLALLPEKVSPFITREEYVTPKGIAEPIATLFFKYAQKDPQYLSSSISEIPSSMVRFGGSMERLKNFVNRASFGVPLRTLEDLVLMRNTSYDRDWKKMASDLYSTVEREKSAEKEGAELLREYRQLFINCRMVMRFERQENLKISHLYDLRLQLYATLGLENQ